MSGGFDVAIIGGGVVGTAIADRLASTTASVCLLEQASDVAEGASKGNGGVTNSGYDGQPGTLEGNLVAASSAAVGGHCAATRRSVSADRAVDCGPGRRASRPAG